MMGDDTWTQLFPDHFERSYPYPSFNVKDLHTVRGTPYIVYCVTLGGPFNPCNTC